MKNKVLPPVRTDSELFDAVYKKASELGKPMGFVIEKSLRIVLGVKEKELVIFSKKMKNIKPQL